MGAPKQKWTAEEEGALRAGVLKHGSGKWRTILKDPEFSGVLYLRSNVDLKDKWRNMSVMNTGYISGGKSRASIKRAPMLPNFVKQEEATTSVSDVPQSDEETVDVKPICMVGPPLQIAAAPKRSIVRLDNLILDAITNLNEPGGSNKTAIATYIEDQYWAPQDFKRVLSAKLKFLTATGKLVKVKHNYRISQFPVHSDKKRNGPNIAHEGMQMNFPIVEKDDELNMLKAQIDVELAKMRSMTPAEASLAAARAVAEAEIAIAQAEEAAREADEAEADAEAALAFAAAARKMLRGRSSHMMM